MNVVDKAKKLLKDNRPISASVEIAKHIDKLCWENKFDEVKEFVNTIKCEDFNPQILRFCCIQLSHIPCDKDTYVKFYNSAYDAMKNIFELDNERLDSFEKRLKWENLR